MLSLVTVSPVITAFHSWCLSHHVFDQVNLWPAWVGFETAIFWQCSPGTLETHRLYPLRHDSYHHQHHYHIALVARISLTLSRHSSLSFIALGRSSGQHPVCSHSCWMYIRAGRPAFARPCVGVHKSTSLMSSSLLLQQCPACLVRLTWIVFVILFTNPSARAGYDTRSIFKRSLTGLNSEFSFS